MPHPELTLERRIDAELCGLDAKCAYTQMTCMAMWWSVG
mgnify:FL=1